MRRAVERLGGGLDESTYAAGFVNCVAPPGELWAATGDTHFLCVSWANPGFRYGQRMTDEFRRMQRDAVADALERVAAGVCDCDDAGCDVCHD